MRRALVIFVLIFFFVVSIVKQGPVYAASLADIIVTDMSQASEGTPHGVPGYSWETSSDGGDTTSFPGGFGAIQGWGHLYESVDGNPASNSRVQIRNFQTWWLSKSTGQWTRGQYENNFGGAAFQENYNGAKDGNIQMIDGLPTITAGGGYNFHFWHTQDGWNVPDPNDYKAIVTGFEARLVLGNAGGPDDRAQAKYLITSAIDTYVSQGNHGSDGKLPNLGIGRAKWVTSNWRLYTHNTISQVDPSVIRNNPPPMVIGADNVDVGGGGTTIVPTTPTGCAKKTAGDADCDGTIRIADYAKWRQEFNGILTTKTADFNSDTKVSLADYSIWRTSFVKGVSPSGGPVPTTGAGSCVGGKGVAVKIMPLGDSVTDGTDGRGGYRFKLYNLLKANNTLFDFVGPNQSGSVPDNDHAGFGGYAAGNAGSSSGMQLSKVVGSFVPSMKPDVVLVMAGVNDVYNLGMSPAVAGQDVVNLVKQLNGYVPNAKIIVAGETSWGPQDTGGGERGTLNTALNDGIDALILQGLPVIYAATMETSVTNQYTPVDVHPTADGYDKMADVWFSYLNPILCK
ncbi:hypothetical protein HYS00_01090 [Candidatus Microgenomates bacterium]|nr:hypothetical protein [Candidatus Microgenomates bacterium]